MGERQEKRCEVKTQKVREGAAEETTDPGSTGTETPGSDLREKESPKEARDAEELAGFQEAGMGIVICCGRKLSWWREKGSAVFEAECGNCGTSYAMDPGYDYFEFDEEDPGESHGRFVRSAS